MTKNNNNKKALKLVRACRDYLDNEFFIINKDNAELADLASDVSASLAKLARAITKNNLKKV